MRYRLYVIGGVVVILFIAYAYSLYCTFAFVVICFFVLLILLTIKNEKTSRMPYT